MKTRKLAMDVVVSVEKPGQSKTDVTVLPIFKDSAFPSITDQVDRQLRGRIRSTVASGHFQADLEKTFWVETPDLSSPWVLLVGLGKKQDFRSDHLRLAYGSVTGDLIYRQISSVALSVPLEALLARDFEKAIEGFLLANYTFDKYRKDPPEKLTLKRVTISAPNQRMQAALKTAIPGIRLGVEATFMARDLVNEPANVLTPTALVRHAEEVAKTKGLRIQVFREADLKRMKMNLILAVGMGSEERPCLVHMEYRPKKKAATTIALVGKGVTFDSGGLSIKPQAGMYGMKADMSGAAAVVSALSALPELAPNVHVHGILPIVENLPSGHSVRPGDVFVAYNGKSVEIENTDAEGRLILADALAYAESLGADTIIDLATLTGACVVALGEDIAGIFSRDQNLVNRIQAASKESGESFWPLPLEDSYKRLLKSDCADFKNVGGKYGGAITGALFLSEFVEKAKWAHLDIAGPAFIERDWPICPKGATGFGVRTLLELLSSTR